MTGSTGSGQHDEQATCPYPSDPEATAWHQGYSRGSRIGAERGRADERQRIRRELIEGDPGRLEVAFREFADDEGAAGCAMVVADLLAGDVAASGTGDQDAADGGESC